MKETNIERRLYHTLCEICENPGTLSVKVQDSFVAINTKPNQNMLEKKIKNRVVHNARLAQPTQAQRTHYQAGARPSSDGGQAAGTLSPSPHLMVPLSAVGSSAGSPLVVAKMASRDSWPSPCPLPSPGRRSLPLP